MALMALNQLIQSQLEEKVSNGWLTPEEAEKIWNQRSEVRVVIRKLYQVKGESLTLEEELGFIDQVFRLCLGDLGEEPFSVDSAAFRRWLA